MALKSGNYAHSFRHVINAAKHPIDLDDRQVHAVQARIELDLRIGYAFTRWLTLSLTRLGGSLSTRDDGKKRVFSYGSSPTALFSNLIY
jgi:DNA topoisomerase-3